MFRKIGVILTALSCLTIGMVAATRPGDGVPDSRSEFARLPADIAERVRRELDRY